MSVLHRAPALPAPLSPLEAERLRCDVREAHKRITEDEATIDRQRHALVDSRDAIDRLHRECFDLKQQVRQFEIDKARLAAEQARIDFAFEAACWVVADLRAQLGKTEDDDCEDPAEVEALAVRTFA